MIRAMFECIRLDRGALAIGFLVVAATAAAQEVAPADTTEIDLPGLLWVTPITVTVTRTATDVFDSPQAVSVLDRSVIEERSPDTVADLFRDLPGLDVSGVGPNQARPTIRGQRGQRILLLEDGMRLNNTRRQQDFGELPGLIDVSAVERVEVVRGPSSVLYGTDAIGGVVNIITRTPDEPGFHGSVGYRYSTHDDQNKGEFRIEGREGRFGFIASGTVREADPYDAPRGSFGEIELSEKTLVQGTGIEDESFNLYADYNLADGHRAFAKFERYRADDAGFGSVDPAAFAPDLPTINISYPFQQFRKYTLGYEAESIDLAVADRFNAVAYSMDNERRFDLDVVVMFDFPGAPPNSGVAVETENFTDLETVGFRLEAQKAAAARHRVTYGVDFFRDESANTDQSVSTVFGFGPPMIETSDRPQLPNATYRSFGVFVQDEVEINDRTSVIVGVRFQDLRTETKPTVGLDDPPVTSSNEATVAAANVLFDVSERVKLIASIGRGFRVPNLVEQFFNGATPEGGGFQVRNPGLEPETSLNLELGARYRGRFVFLEAFVFQNELTDGIRIEALEEEVDGLPAFRNVNVDELTFKGVELAADVRLMNGITFGGSYTRLESEDDLDPENPVGETFSDKATFSVGYREPADRWWVEYGVRHNGERKEAILVTNPLGSTLPSFTVQTLRGGVRLFQGTPYAQRLSVTLRNLSDELYAEFSNASFFRPEAGRSLLVSWAVDF